MTWLYLFLKGGISLFFQLPFNTFLAKRLHIKLLRIYIYFIGFTYYFFKRKELAAIKNGIYYFLNLDYYNNKLCRIYTPSYYKALLGIYEHYLEKLMMAYRPLKKLLLYFDKRLTIKKSHLLEDALKTKGGAIIVTGHFGAVEFLPMALYLRGYNVAMICRFKTSKLKNELAERAKYKNITLIDANEPKVALKALQELRKGKVLITECDEFKEWRTGSDEINILGTKAYSDKTLDIFYRKSKVPAILGLMRRDREGKYSLCLESLADGEEKVSIAKTAWKEYEKYIERHPFQWYQWADFSKIILKKEFNDKKNIHIPVTNSIPVPDYS